MIHDSDKKWSGNTSEGAFYFTLFVPFYRLPFSSQLYPPLIGAECCIKNGFKFAQQLEHGFFLNSIDGRPFKFTVQQFKTGNGISCISLKCTSWRDVNYTVKYVQMAGNSYSFWKEHCAHFLTNKAITKLIYRWWFISILMAVAKDFFHFRLQ